MSVFVRKDVATRQPQPGDVWLQVLSMSSHDFERHRRQLILIDSELHGEHDLCILLHVEEIPTNALTEPGELFAAPCERDPPFVPAGEEPGAGAMVGDVMAEGRPVRGAEENEDGDVKLDGVPLNMATPLKDLKDLCAQLGLATSGAKPTVLKRLRDHHEVMEKQLASEVARKLFQEQERAPETLRAPVLPSARQQELHAITHQPFASWCPSCVLGRSKQSPHKVLDPDKRPELGDTKPCIQIDYCNTFTSERGEGQAADGQDGAEAQAAVEEGTEEIPDYKSVWAESCRS